MTFSAAALKDISPFVRFVKIIKSAELSGEWLDYDHVFTFIEQGQADFILNGVRYQLGEGDAIVMPLLMTHFIRSTSSEPLIQYIFHFDLYHDDTRSRWQSIGIVTGEQLVIPEREQLLQSLHPVSAISGPDRMELKKLFLIMRKRFIEGGTTSELELKAIALQLLVLFLRNQSGHERQEGTQAKAWAPIQQCIDYIQQYFADPELDNDRISEQAGLSPGYLSNLFKEQTGVTLHKYLTYVRIEHAKKRIMAGKETLTAISAGSGFSSIHHFSRIFKREAGLTPSQFKAEASGPIRSLISDIPTTT
ncbi:AraC-type DNA-binding protein [Paenibacillus algorifonticola]|uniref:AraC-type DNA-binding protein n=1 Tax=Paenibacillus algorifonticola TaxID=684063 RepID=A0A1I2ETJ5_9BACL|nr:AraC family transcriptional regulator [Paenibacillus algorifonticola]SFE95947.1 AraC-type DNA-binding protein [Paenibacillus algorifonticola]